MKKTILIISLVACFVLASGLAIAAMPSDSCYKMATNKHRAVKNMGGDLQWSGDRINPCTGELDTAKVYYYLKGGVTHMKTVYGNGDVEGTLGLTKYVVCQDERAKVMHKIYGPGASKGKYAWGRGFYFNFPFDDDPSTWIKDKKICDTF